MYQLSYLSIDQVGAIIEGRREEFRVKDRSQWMQTRYLAWTEITGNPYIPRHEKPRTPQDLFLMKGERRRVKKVNIKKMKETTALMRQRWNIN